MQLKGACRKEDLEVNDPDADDTESVLPFPCSVVDSIPYYCRSHPLPIGNWCKKKNSSCVQKLLSFSAAAKSQTVLTFLICLILNVLHLDLGYT